MIGSIKKGRCSDLLDKLTKNQRSIFAGSSSNGDALLSSTEPPDMENPAEQAVSANQELQDLISQLPFHEGFPPLIGFRKYQGTWNAEMLVAGIVGAQRHFKARPTDILIASFPKSGTTWLKALVFSTVSRSRHSSSAHPLHSLSPHDCVPTLEEKRQSPEILAKIDAVSVPRLLSTHMPFSMLPDSVKNYGCRILYICRDPKDALISMWHFINRTSGAFPLGKMFEMFCDGVWPYGLIWDHVLGYWNESIKNPESVLFMAYEELLEAPMEKLTRIAEFSGCPFSDEEIAAGVPAEILRLCSFENLRDAALRQDSAQAADAGGDQTLYMRNEHFYRKGTSGDWRSHLTPEMAQRIDQITEQKLRGSGLAIGRASWVEITTLDA